MPNSLVRLLATFFYVGLLPIAPGTTASVLGVIFYFLLYKNPIIFGFAILTVVGVGFFVSGKMEKVTGEPDPDCIVIDEVAGSMIAFFLLPHHMMTPAVIVTTFFLFRGFDMFKIYPANKLESLPGAGVMMDDLVAGLYTNLTMQIAIRLAYL